MKSFFKVIGQIVLILAVAGLIIGGLYAAVQSNAFSLPTRGDHTERFEGREFVEGQRPPRPEGDFEGGEHGERGPDLARGLFGVVGSLIKLSVIVVIILFIQNLFNRWQARKTPAAA